MIQKTIINTDQAPAADVMSQYFTEPYPARAAIGVTQLPKAALIEADGIMMI